MNIATPSPRLARIYWDVENTHDTRELGYFPKAIQKFLSRFRKFLIRQHIEIEGRSRVYLKHLRMHLPAWKSEVSQVFSQGEFFTLWCTIDAEARLAQDIAVAIKHAENTRVRCTYPLPSLVIIISGDNDVLDAVQKLQSSGRVVWIISKRGKLSRELQRTANQCFFIEKILSACTFEIS